MDHVIAHVPDFLNSIIGQFLTPLETCSLAVACQAFIPYVEPFALGIAFALTRVCLNRRHLTLRQWMDVWHVCAKLTAEQGIPPVAWSYAMSFTVHKRSYVGDGDLHPALLPPHCFSIFIDNVITQWNNDQEQSRKIPQATWILLLQGADRLVHSKSFFCLNVETLLILEDGCFAHVSIHYTTAAQRISCDIYTASDPRLLSLEILQDEGGRMRFMGRKLVDAPYLQERMSLYPWSPCMDFWPSIIIEAKPLLRKAADGIFYTHEDFIKWYRNKLFAEMRWEQAAPRDHLGSKMMQLICKQGCPSCGSWNITVRMPRVVRRDEYYRACPSF